MLVRLGRFELEQALPPLLRNIEWKEDHPAFYCRISAQQDNLPTIPVWEIGRFVNPGLIHPMTNVMSTLGACGPVVISDYDQDWAQPAIKVVLNNLHQQYKKLLTAESAARAKAIADRDKNIDVYKILLGQQMLELTPNVDN